LIETPKLILKGLAELMDPHVMLAKQIRDVSRMVFQAIRTPPGGQQALGVAIGEINTVLNVIPLPPPLKPRVAQEGIDLVGSLPYLAFNPPGPLGAAYILLDLLSMDIAAADQARERQETIQNQTGPGGCSDPPSPSPLPGLPAPTPLGSPSPGAQPGAEGPSSTYKCE